MDQLQIPLEIIISRDQILRTPKERCFQEEVVLRIAATLETARGEYNQGPHEEKLQKLFDLNTREGVFADDPGVPQRDANFIEEGGRNNGVEPTLLPCGPQTRGRSGWIQKSGNPNVGIKQNVHAARRLRALREAKVISRSISRERKLRVRA